MADKAKQRVAALGKQLAPIRQVAGPSTGRRVDGKVVIITGANSERGIGRASAHQFAANGARAVYICDFDASNLEAHRAEMSASYPGVDVHVRQFDAGNEDAVKEVIADAMQKYGRLDVFFANAGIVGKPQAFTEVEKDDFMKVMETNIARYVPIRFFLSFSVSISVVSRQTLTNTRHSVWLAAKHAAPAMLKTSADKPASSGSIIGTASVAGIRSNAGPTPYSAAKAAVINMAATVAYQMAGTGVRMNAICPGLIETGMTAPTFDAARARGTERKIGQLNPLKRGGAADEIARVALFLGSDEASYVNGQAWAVDGGLSAGLPYVPGKLA